MSHTRVAIAAGPNVFHPVTDCDPYTGVQHLQDDHPDGDRLKPEAPSRRKWNDADDRECDAPRAGIKRQCSYLSIRSWNGRNGKPKTHKCADGRDNGANEERCCHVNCLYSLGSGEGPVSRYAE